MSLFQVLLQRKPASSNVKGKKRQDYRPKGYMALVGNSNLIITSIHAFRTHVEGGLISIVTTSAPSFKVHAKGTRKNEGGEKKFAFM